MIRKSTGEYPKDWPAIAIAVKETADWKCVRCGHRHDIENGFMLTVHHLDLNKSNCAWWNIPALCQKCHLQIQHKVVMEQPYMFPHSEWFKPYVAAYYGVVECVFEGTYDYYESLVKVPREQVMARLDELLAYGQGMTPIPGTDHFEEAW